MRQWYSEGTSLVFPYSLFFLPVFLAIVSARVRSYQQFRTHVPSFSLCLFWEPRLRDPQATSVLSTCRTATFAARHCTRVGRRLRARLRAPWGFARP